MPLFFNLEDENLPLPSGWEMRIGPSGFIYYVDHVAKKSQWERPIRGKLEVYFICCHALEGKNHINDEKYALITNFHIFFQDEKGHCITQKYKGRH